MFFISIMLSPMLLFNFSHSFLVLQVKIQSKNCGLVRAVFRAVFRAV